MIVEGRTIRTIEEMREFCAVTRPDGRKVFDVSVVRRQGSLDRMCGLKKGEFLAHRNVHRSEDETANSIIEGAG